MSKCCIIFIYLVCLDYFAEENTLYLVSCILYNDEPIRFGWYNTQPITFQTIQC